MDDWRPEVHGLQDRQPEPLREAGVGEDGGPIHRHREVAVREVSQRSNAPCIETRSGGKLVDVDIAPPVRAGDDERDL